MQAMRVSLLRFRVALGAGNFLRRSFVDKALHICVAIHAGKHAAVNGMLHLDFVHIQAGGLAVYIFCQCGVGVAGKAVRVFDLVFGASRGSPGEQTQNERWSENSTGGVHAYKKMPRRGRSQ